MDDLGRLADDFDRGGDRMRDRAYEMVRRATVQTQTLGKAFSPVLTGRLRQSIASNMSSSPNRVEGETGPDVHYDAYVHFGTSRQEPNPFLYRAADVVEPKFYAEAAALAARTLDG